MQKVYLAGGFRSGWQDKVKKLDGFVWLDPKEKEIQKEEGWHSLEFGEPSDNIKQTIFASVQSYASWDFHYIKEADIVFVYVERTNTSCIGLSVEAGYGFGLGKTVILVLEQNHETIKDKYLEFISKAATITFETLRDGIAFLSTFK